MRKIFAASVLGLALLVGACTNVEAGVVKDKVREPGSVEIKCKGKGISKVCKTETDPESCMFYLVDGTEKGWKAVDCSTTFQEYSIGEQYPR